MISWVEQWLTSAFAKRLEAIFEAALGKWIAAEMATLKEQAAAGTLPDSLKPYSGIFAHVTIE